MYHLTLKGSVSTSDIYIGAGAFGETAKHVAEKFHPSRIHIVTDSHVAPLYLEQLSAQFPIAVTSTVIPAGEEHKNLDTIAGIYADLCAAGITRKDLIIALGGGVIGDMAGFAAATFLRGVSVCQIPTTLLAQVDSSVGGKTGVDLPQGKNLVGAFYQPELVLIDTDLLSTLPDSIFCDGMAEVIKYGCIQNAKILDMVAESNFKENITDIVYECVSIKRDVVQQDEHDTGLRMILNFGHTIGHACEKLGNYVDLTHGQAVAIGMAAAARLNAALGAPDLSERLMEILKAHHLPTELPYAREEIYGALLSDKKKMANTMNFILVDRFGEAKIHPFAIEELHQHILAL